MYEAFGHKYKDKKEDENSNIYVYIYVYTGSTSSGDSLSRPWKEAAGGAGTPLIAFPSTHEAPFRTCKCIYTYVYMLTLVKR